MQQAEVDISSVLAVLESRRDDLRIAQELIEALPIPVFFKARDGRYLGVNRAWEDFFGVARSEMVGHAVRDLYPQAPEIAQRHVAMDEQLWKRPGTQSYEMRLPLPKGYAWRRFLLRCFGAKLGRAAAFARTSRVFHPWLLEIGDWCAISTNVQIYNLGPVKVGNHTVLSQDVYVCAGTHDYGKVSFGSEAALFHKAKMSSVLCGPGHIAQAHQPNEWVALDQLAQCEAFMRQLADVVCDA